ncbi:hypothetical protein ABZ719_36855, partial [Streptomyces sp. NPDC006743]|uniref:hypothetical protein n=1 Tax=Streptomyces sp. NPDC006743 TaxID=3154480 RepID=UPI0034531E3E
YPGAAVPFGMVQFSPDTGHNTGYDHSQNHIRAPPQAHPARHLRPPRVHRPRARPGTAAAGARGVTRRRARSAASL